LKSPLLGIVFNLERSLHFNSDPTNASDRRNMPIHHYRLKINLSHLNLTNTDWTPGACNINFSLVLALAHLITFLF